VIKKFSILEREKSQLADLCDKYESDKGSVTPGSLYSGGWPVHDYTDFYELIFGSLRYSVKNLLEVGIGTNNPNLPSSMGIHGKPGASLRVWRDYFPNAKILGADIDKDILFSEERISTAYLDQTKSSEIEKFFNLSEFKYFDIIIDDGLHTYHAAKTLFENSWDHLNAGGIYIIEDAGWWSGDALDFIENKDVTYFGFGNIDKAVSPSGANERYNKLIMVIK